MSVMKMIVVASLAALLAAGCASEKFVADSKNPEVAFSSDGGLMWRGRFIEPHELPRLLEKTEVDPKSQIDIRVPRDFNNPKAARRLLFMLRRAGYTRAVLVTEKKAYSQSSTKLPPPAARQAKPVKRIRYK
jgi:hypothetical protein